MKPARCRVYLAWIRTQPCLVCGRTQWIEAAHTGLRGLGQKSSDYSAIPLCALHHRTGKDSYHRLGARQFAQFHNLDIPAIVRRLNMKPSVRIEAGMFVAYLEGQQFTLGKISNGIASALRTLRKVCGGNRLAQQADVLGTADALHVHVRAGDPDLAKKGVELGNTITEQSREL